MNKTGSKTRMTPKAASRITEAYTRKHGGPVPKGSFPDRASKAADLNAGKGR